MSEQGESGGEQMPPEGEQPADGEQRPPESEEKASQGEQKPSDSGLQHSHPGGTAAILGVQLLRFSGVQGLSLGTSNFIHYLQLPLVGAFLGVSGLGRYSLLLFLTGLVTQIIHVVTKPGTIRRVFGQGDEDDEDDDEDDAQPSDVSQRPPWTLGIGIVLCIVLAAAFTLVAVIFQRPIANLLLGDPNQGRMVMWASMTAGMLSIFRLTEIVLWFEQRSGPYLLVDTSRPTLNLAFILIMLVSGTGLEGAILGPLIGTTIATVLSIVMLRHSFEWAWNGREVVEILKLSRQRVPVVTSMWVIQNMDTFILSRFVDKHDLGIYNLASRTGFMVALLPQGFRVALRPLRRSAAYMSMKREYGPDVAQGQLLAYFFLLCFTSILAMFLLGEALVHDATGDFASAAGLIPLSAGAMTMPALFRTLNSMAIHPKGRKTFIIGIVFVAVVYIGLAILIVPMIGIYGPPTAILIAFVGPVLYISLRSQLSEQPIDFPYWSTLRALGVAAGIAVFFQLVHPSGRWPQLAEIVGLMALWFGSLFVLRIVPEHHRRPLMHMARSAIRGSAVEFDAEGALRALRPKQRAALRPAVLDRMPPEEIGPQGEKLVKILRRAGRAGEAPMGPTTELDGELALYLFSDESMASRQTRMRGLLSRGVETHDLQLLEDVMGQLAKAPEAAWNGEGADGSRRGIAARLRRAERSQAEAERPQAEG